MWSFAKCHLTFNHTLKAVTAAALECLVIRSVKNGFRLSLQSRSVTLGIIKIGEIMPRRVSDVAKVQSIFIV
jgi:hypothetical protein